MPRDAPRIWTDDYYKRIFQVPRAIILTERNMQYPQIFTDGRPLPRIRIQPGTATRSPVGWRHAGGADRRASRDDLWLDAIGHPLGKRREADRKDSAAQLRDAGSRDDDRRSEAYTAPWTVKMSQPLVLDSELLDYYCLENEKSRVHMKK